MSMLTFALVSNPLISLLEQHLTGKKKIGHWTAKTAVVAYAADVRISMEAPAAIQVIGDLLLTLRKGNGCSFEHLKIQSCGGRLVGHIGGHAGHPILSGLGFRFTSAVARSGNVTWSRTKGKVTALARDAYGRDLCLK